jgi:hypothetical protein
MTNKELFKEENLVFVSKHEGVVGSLYFRAIGENGNVYRGRIRLNHDHGPQISNAGTPEEVWLLVTERGLSAYKDGKGKREERRTKIPQDEILGDLVKNFDNTLDKAEGKTIYEVYSNGSHPSRGQLTIVGKGCMVPNLNQEQIDLIRDTILGETKGNGNCKDTNGEYDKKLIADANKAIIKLTKEGDFPGWITQESGKFGC